MKPGPLFHLAATPLAPGATLIEASAGTGKTFTIAGLFVRLLLEQKLSVREILVVTFTEAATEELRDRIRKKLTGALAAFTEGTSADGLFQALLARPDLDQPDARAALENALTGFDEAPVFTIHGFCQRMLKDRAFESGSLFDVELAQDQSPLLRAIAEDYWRRQFYAADPVLVRFALKNKFSPEKFLPLLTSSVSHPSLRFVSRVDGQPLSDLAAALLATFDETRRVWLAERAQLRPRFGRDAGWANRPFNSTEEMTQALDGVDACFSADAATPEALAALGQFTATAIREGTKKKPTEAAPTSRFFALCEELARREADYLTGLQLDFLGFAREELPRRKERDKVQSFDDLLTRLRAALAGPGGDALAAAIRARYPAALIDEFQDTDPVQYEIFRRIFMGPPALHEPKANFLFLIGDPKQAIYGFRGADIFTYLQAAHEAQHRYTLGENWRSASRLVGAVNTLFGAARRPFVFEDIAFQPVAARGAADQEPLRLEGEAKPPFQFWFCQRGDEKAISREWAKAELPRVVAAEMARLLNGDVRLGHRKLRPDDLAVLVETHSQVRLVQAALAEWKIPSVQHTTASLFEAREAAEVERILAAIAQPANERLLKAALATDLLGVNGPTLDGFARDEGAWQARLENFHDYLERWGRDGFIPMFQFFLRRERVRMNLLRFPDGERRLTNVLHLAEVLHQAAVERRLGAEGLIQWLAEMRQSDQPTSDEHQLRLERDENAVKLVTIHKSKGLEYAVVFCPFVWKNAELRRHAQEEERVLFHDAQAGHQLVRDLGSAELDAHRQLAKLEALGENTRLLYVALTRARHRCYLVWGAFKNAATSAPAWLLHAPPDEAASAVEALESGFTQLSDAEMQAALRALAEQSRDTAGEPAIAVDKLPLDAPAALYRPPEAPVARLASRDFAGHIARDWRISSFSWLTAGQRGESPDRDPAEPVVREEEAASGIFAFPRGTKAGTCLHEMFEALDFTGTNAAAMETLVAEKLRAHGFADPAHPAAIGDMLRRTLAVPLGPAGLTLARVPQSDRLNELEFYFPLKKLDPPQLRAVFARWMTPAGGEFAAKLERLNFDPVGGFLKGFIDLVFRFEDRFYLVDWKSNHLGNRVEDYGPEALRHEMGRHYYILQYHLYTVALHQYLALRLPGYDYEKHFGGVRYVFIRGVDPARPELGVFRDRPTAALVGELGELLIAKDDATS